MRDKAARKKLVLSAGGDNLKEDQKRFCKVLWEAMRLRWRKLNDYGASYRNFGPLGVVVRMSDKMSRMERLMKNGKAMVNDESMRDTAIDLINYSAMLVMLLDEKKRK